FFQILSEGVHRFEGTINQYTGDGIMALFGAPIAHENHAQRACYAALHLAGTLKEYADSLRIERGLNLSIRMGINSGEVVVGRIGDDLRMDYTAQGHTVGLAQRMESLAEPGKALLASATIDIVEGYFELHDLGEAQVKGVEQPVRIAELVGVGAMRTRLDRSRARGLSKFVGREEEVARLESALERTIAGDGQVIGIVADAGAGKSRLCHELAEICRARGVQVRMGQGVAHGSAVPLLPILQFYREIFGIEDDDGDPEARQKIAGLIAQILPDALESLPLLFEFMRVPDPARPAPDLTPDERRRALSELIRRLTVARSETAPAVLIFEDLHWIDPQSAEIIETLVDTAAETRTLLILNFRPEFRADWTGRSHYQQIALRPLDAAATGELLSEWLGPDPSLSGLVELVVSETGGNPFFVEEVVQDQIDAGVLVGARGHFQLERPVASIRVPASVQSLLAARIDRLGEEAKRLLQTAAVIGQEQPELLLAEVEGLEPERLRVFMRALVQSEFLYEQTLYPEIEYAFKHPLTREVAYETLLGERRREIHARVARSLEAQVDESSDAHAAMLAYHYEQGDLPLDAARWHERATLEVFMGSTQESLYHARKILGLLEGVPASPMREEVLNRARGKLIYAASRSELPDSEVEELFEQALRGLDPGDARARASALTGYSVARWGRGERVEAIRLAEEAVDLGRRGGDDEVTAGALAALLNVRGPTESPRLTIETFAEIEELCGDRTEPSGKHGFPPLLMGGPMCVIALWFAGRGDDAEKLLRRLSERYADLPMSHSGVILVVQTQALSRRGDHAGACDEARRLVEACRSGQNTAALAIGYAALGMASLRAGQPDEAARALSEAVKISVDRGLSLGIAPVHLASLAEAEIECGDLAAAYHAIERGRKLAAEQEALLMLGVIDLQHARLILAEADTAASDRAREKLDAIESLAHERGNQGLLA
ncbi:MAG: AAA family ATPase, partial [Deltaproteobacteria bacterium]|nr:AAA family ATPase [Deltaproteobacteria bacterium]